MRLNKINDLTDDEILEGLRKQNSAIVRNYFYQYCRIAYCISDKRYSLSHKNGFDFYSLAHEYYIKLYKNNWKQLEDRKQEISLKNWIIGGFRFIILDRLKSYSIENKVISFDEQLKHKLDFIPADSEFKMDFHNTIDEICNTYFNSDRKAQTILRMLLIERLKGKEIAIQLGMTPPAVTQRYHKMMNEIVIPYFKNYYKYIESPSLAIYDDIMTESIDKLSIEEMKTDYKSRITPERITALAGNEIFVFGSNLQGMHGGGAAYQAHRYFGAVLGQGTGLQGQSYAIPTMQGGTETIKPYVDEFIAFAISHPQYNFLVTQIGCGIAGFDPEEIAPLFEQAVSVTNIFLPKSFWKILM